MSGRRAHILISLPAEGAAAYPAAVTAAGGEATALYCPRGDVCCDGLLLAGGGDPDPALYGRRCAGSAPPDRARDRAELALLDAFAAAGKPVLGVCRGLQLINIWAGGTLLQDLGARNGAHRWAGADRAHPVHTAEDSLLRRLYGVHFWVNSAHHQALELPGAGLRVTARAPDGVVEAIAHSTLPLWAVQFHPERMRPALGWPGAADGTALLRYFVRRCAGACISEENGVC